MEEREQIVQEMIEELAELLRVGEVLAIVHFADKGARIAITDLETSGQIDGGDDPVRLLASRIKGVDDGN